MLQYILVEAQLMNFPYWYKAKFPFLSSDQIVKFKIKAQTKTEFLVCFERQLKYSSVVRLATRNEAKYYRQLANYCQKRMRIFPYHLQVCFILSITRKRVWILVEHENRKNGWENLGLNFTLYVSLESSIFSKLSHKRANYSSGFPYFIMCANCR